MRVETDVDILLGCAIGLIIAWLFDYKFKSVAIARVLLAMMLAFTMPAWLPGHGEIVLLLPSVALFLVVSTMAFECRHCVVYIAQVFQTVGTHSDEVDPIHHCYAISAAGCNSP
ncbi:MAG: hypothetical protein OFPII_00610 [Osedax symbiont Rs1]|nr:MAG: hypothetical protein OFPII_00610 [Osedax symbiont Rs1]